MNFQEKLGVLAGVVLAGFGAVMLLGGLLLFLEPTDSTPRSSSLVLMFLLGGGPLILGLFLTRAMLSRGGKRRQEAIEREVLGLAKGKNGLLSVADITLHTKLNSREAKTLLENLHLEGLAEIEVSEKGDLSYRFPGI